MVGGYLGYPHHDWMGTPHHHDWMEYPSPWLDGVPPRQVWMMGGYPIPGLDGGGYLGYPPSQVWMVGGYLSTPTWLDGYPPPPWLDGYPHHHDWMGYPPNMTGWGTPPWLDGVPPHQHSKHLLHDGWYASCVYAGGLSCLFYFLKPLVSILYRNIRFVLKTKNPSSYI